MRQKDLLVVFALGCLLWAALPAMTTSAAGWAVLVGIDDYNRPEVTDLLGASKDAEAIRDALIQYAGFSKGHVFSLTNEDATIGDIGVKLEYIAAKAHPEDSFVFFFAGHGLAPEEEDSYLLVYNSDIRTALSVERTCLPVSSLKRQLERIPAGRSLVMMDACRNDPSAGRGGGDNVLGERMARGIVLRARRGDRTGHFGSATLYACEVGHRAYESSKLRRGFFSLALVEALSGKAADRDGNVTLNTLEEYLASHVPDMVQRELGVMHTQTPWAERSGMIGGWVISQGTPVLPGPTQEQIPFTGMQMQKKRSKKWWYVGAAIVGGAVATKVAMDRRSDEASDEGIIIITVPWPQ